MFKYLLSYLSFGLLAPFFQTFRSEKKYSFELCGKLSKLENLEERESENVEGNLLITHISDNI